MKFIALELIGIGSASFFAAVAEAPVEFASWIQAGGTLGTIGVLIWVVVRMDKAVAESRMEAIKQREAEAKERAEERLAERVRVAEQFLRREQLAEKVTDALQNSALANASIASAFRHMSARIIEVLGQVRGLDEKTIARDVNQAMASPSIEDLEHIKKKLTGER